MVKKKAAAGRQSGRQAQAVGPGEERWAEGCCVVRRAVPEKLFAALRELPHGLKQQKRKAARWLPREALETPRDTLVEQVVQFTYRNLLPAVDFDPQRVVGVEWWTHVRRGGGKMHMHFDRDEAAWEADGTMRHPTLASIMYIQTGEGAPTLIVDQRCDPSHTVLLPRIAKAADLVPPEENSFATFQGDRLHGVLNYARVRRVMPRCAAELGDAVGDEEEEREGDARVTLLMNWWTEEISTAEEMSEAMTRDEQWAYGEALRSPLWEKGPAKTAREGETVTVKGVNKLARLYTYDLTGDISTSEEEDGGPLADEGSESEEGSRE